MDDRHRERDAEGGAEDEAQECGRERDPGMVEERAARAGRQVEDRLFQFDQDLVRGGQDRPLHGPGLGDERAGVAGAALALPAVADLRGVEDDRRGVPEGQDGGDHDQNRPRLARPEPPRERRDHAPSPPPPRPRVRSRRPRLSRGWSSVRRLCALSLLEDEGASLLEGSKFGRWEAEGALLPTVFDLCTPRADVLEGKLEDTRLAADLAQVLNGRAPPVYADPALFFANTYPTRGLADLLRAVLQVVSGAGGETGAVFRLHTHFGGGKTHALVALVHAVRAGRSVTTLGDFVDPTLLPREPVALAAFDGENADPVNGRRLAPDVLAFTPWGELAFQLAGREGFARVAESDRLRVAPGADTLRELVAGRPTLLLLDELAIWLRKTKPLASSGAGEQLAAFLSALLKLVATTPRCALVFTLAVGKDLAAADAYAAEHEEVARVMEELASIAARNATILNPTREEETVAVLKRRLFERIDEAAGPPIVGAYGELWKRFADHLPPACRSGEAVEALRASWPFHPDLVAVLTEKLASLSKFQRIRGMLRLLGRALHRLWRERPKDAHAIHTHHLDLGFQPIRDELTIRLERPDMVPPLVGDVAAGEEQRTTTEGKPAGLGLARELDRRTFAGMPPYASYVARTIFFHSLAYPDDRAGIAAPELRFALLSPALEFEFVEQARKLFAAESSFLDDRPGAPYRFRTEPNLTQILRREEARVDAGELRDRLNARIREIFDGRTLELVPFPAGPFDVQDETSGKRPRLVLIGHEAATVDRLRLEVPELVLKIFRERGSTGEFRRARNHLLFLLAEEQEVETMRKLVRRKLALEALARPPWTQQLPEYQRKQIDETKQKFEAEIAAAIQKAYRHILYPSRVRAEGIEEDLAHSVLEHPAAAAKPGDGQRMIVERLRELGKLRLAEDEPDSPAYVRDRTPLKKGSITTAALRKEFTDDPALPMLVGDDVFFKLVRRGVEQGEFVYRRGDLIWAKGLPAPGSIAIDEESELFTAAYARDKGIWPRPEPEPTEPPPPSPGPPPPAPPTGGGSAVPGAPPPPARAVVEAEAPLREALARVFEQARGRGWRSLAWLELRPFDPADALTLAGLAGLLPGARKRYEYEVGIERPGPSCFELRFSGPPEEEKPVRDFLRPQLEAARAAGATIAFDATIRLDFDNGLALSGDAPEQLRERLAKAGAAAAQVRASAGGEP